MPELQFTLICIIGIVGALAAFNAFDAYLAKQQKSKKEQEENAEDAKECVEMEKKEIPFSFDSTTIDKPNYSHRNDPRPEAILDAERALNAGKEYGFETAGDARFDQFKWIHNDADCAIVGGHRLFQFDSEESMSEFWKGYYAGVEKGKERKLEMEKAREEKQMEKARRIEKAKTCPVCKGNGILHGKNCLICDGNGRTLYPFPIRPDPLIYRD